MLGVLNKVDRADPSEIEIVAGHVARELGDLIETIVPFSATRAAAARVAGKPDPALTALTTALDERFFTQARALKRATALSTLRRLLASARTAAEAVAPAPHDGAAARAALTQLEQGGFMGQVQGDMIELYGPLVRHACGLREPIDLMAAIFEERDRRSLPHVEEVVPERLRT